MTTRLPARREQMTVPTPSNFQELQAFGNLAAESGYFKDVRQAAQACVKIQTGLELGLAPMQALGAIHIVEGKPTLSANLIAALLKRAGYKWRVEEHNPQTCRLRIFDAQGEDLGLSEFTMQEAKQAGLAGRGNWSKYPKAMLFARAISQAARWFAPEVALGVYEPDELAPTVEVVAPQPSRPAPSMSHRQHRPRLQSPQAPPEFEPPDPSKAPAPIPDTDHDDIKDAEFMEAREDDGSYAFMNGQKGSRWFDANVALATNLKDLGFDRDHLKALLKVESLSSFGADELRGFNIKVGQIGGLLVEQLKNSQTANEADAIWLDAKKHFGVLVELAEPVKNERILQDWRSLFEAATTLDNLRDAFASAKETLPTPLLDKLIPLKNQLKNQLSGKKEVTQEAAQTAPCKGCGAPIEWREAEWSGKPHPFDPGTDTSHFKTCPNAEDFRKGKAA